MTFTILTLFPEMVEAVYTSSIIGRAVEAGHIAFSAVNIRDYTADKHKKVDDYPYGGGAGMVMQAQPIYDAWESVVKSADRECRTIYLCPQGEVLTQKKAHELAECEKDLILLCGHYEGVDERVLEEIGAEKLSIGDYVLTGGELAAMVAADAVARLVPGVLSNAESAQGESFENGLLEYPQYSRPAEWRGRKVPEILLSGDHAKVDAWRLEQSLLLTERLRPDLYREYETMRKELEKTELP